MRRFATIVLACALGLTAAFAFAYIAGLVRPCRGEGLACSMTQIVTLIYVPVFSAVALIVFSIATFWKNDSRALTLALLLPLVPFMVLISCLKFFEISVRDFYEIRERDVQEILQIAIPIILTLVVPWLILLRAGRPKIETNAHG